MKYNNKTSLSDVPFRENINDFGTERYVNGLIKFIENSSAPITIALQGEWGSGKTSMMTRLERALCSTENAPFIGVNINTWEYSMMSSPEITVYKILAKLVRELTGGNIDSKKKVSNILRGLYRGGREALKMIPGVNIAVELANVPADIPVEDNDISLSELRDELQRAVQSRIAEKNQRGVIVFVDDLDRLNPPVAVEILELLKNVFTLDNCIFVLAIDYDVVVKGLEPKFGKLTDKNEREFRSFFDKIIQVPFSLPVSRYRPMDFLLKALVGIGYISEFAADNPNVKTCFSSIVEASVGKNPRSIKRLINTLSLLDCIAQCGTDVQKRVEVSLEDKIMLFIVVAMQICYPRIYDLLTHDSAFMHWDLDFAIKHGIIMDSEKQENITWTEIIEEACSTDKYMTQHLSDIIDLLSMILDMSKTNEDTNETADRLKRILDQSSVTGVNSGIKAEEFDKKELIYKLHENVVERIRKLRPDITTFKLKRNTGNGGIYIWYDEDACLDVTFTPDINDRNEISLRLWLHFIVPRPERMTDLSFDEMLNDGQLASSLKKLDDVITPMLKDVWFFKGQVYEGQKTYFPSFTDELRYIHEKGWLHEIINNPYYWIDLKKPSHFENKEVVDVIAKLLIANYDFRKSMKDWG